VGRVDDGPGVFGEHDCETAIEIKLNDGVIRSMAGTHISRWKSMWLERISGSKISTDEDLTSEGTN
jgi:hypothetical protein